MRMLPLIASTTPKLAAGEQLLVVLVNGTSSQSGLFVAIGK
jgi:hypothetical protein